MAPSGANWTLTFWGDRMPLFKTRLHVSRAGREWSQAELVAQVGVTRETIKSIAKGRFHPTVKVLSEIALLHLSPDSRSVFSACAN